MEDWLREGWGSCWCWGGRMGKGKMMAGKITGWGGSVERVGRSDRGGREEQTKLALLPVEPAGDAR